MAKKVSAVLEKARDILENTGWCKGDFYTGQDGQLTQACALGAIRMAAGFKLRWDKEAEFFDERYTTSQYVLAQKAGNALASVTQVVFSDVIVAGCNYYGSDVPGFNDRSGTTKQDVLDWFGVGIIAAQVQERREAAQAKAAKKLAKVGV